MPERSPRPATALLVPLLPVLPLLPMIMPQMALAQTATQPTPNRRTSASTELLLSGDQIVTTASRKAQRASEVPAAVTVFTEEDIRAMGATSLLDVLRYAPSVDVFELNRSVADVSIRGSNEIDSNKLLVMVDGRPIYQDYIGGVFWFTEPILLARIKRIEIVRGTGSALYGANAFNGVINIITKTPRELAEAPSKSRLRAFVGEHATTLNELLTSDKTTSGWSYAFGAGYNRTDGFGGRQTGQVRDSYTTPILTLDAQKPLKRGSLLLAVGNSEATTDFYETVVIPDGHFHTSYASATYTEQGVKDPITARVFANFIYLTEPHVVAVDNKTLDFELQQQRALSRQHNLVYGGDYRHIMINSALATPGSHQEELFSFYMQDEWRLARKTRLFTGVRLDQNSLYGFNVTPRMSLLHNLSADQTLRLSAGTAFRNPTLLDTFGRIVLPIAPQQNLTVLGNTDLHPERVTSLEAGYRKNIRGGYLGVNGFYNADSSLLNYVPTQTMNLGGTPVVTQEAVQNTKGAKILGLELEAQLRLSNRLRGLINYSYQHIQQDQGIPTGPTPPHKANVALMAQLSSRWDAFLGAHYVDGSLVQTAVGKINVASYVRADARIGYRFGTQNHPLTLSLLGTNLFDDRHIEYPYTSVGATPFIAKQRRTLYLTADLRF